MPKRTDIKKIMIIGAGPIIIGQACEFDYSGTQGVKALKEEGYEVVLINSNPATIMTDPELADRTYIEPITPEVVARIIAKEKPDALLPTLGGQTALNTALALHEQGVLQKHRVELIGANVDAIQKAEDRMLFRKAMKKIGVPVPRSAIVRNQAQALKAIKDIGFPAILRPAFTLGGMGGAISYNLEDYKKDIKWALDCSPKSQVLVEQSILGWKEYELEVVRDHRDNVIIVCSIENFDAMGVHTGDSLTVAPAQTLTDREYQALRDASVKIIREIGVDTGGSNIQFATNPKTGDMIVIEMNPRVSRSSALASKATGFPIAKIAAKLAIGYSLDELNNDITRDTPASFEPSIDYVVTKLPRFTFEKFPAADDRLGTQMKSVGEAMAIGRTFAESLQKGMRSLEVGSFGFEEKKLRGKSKSARKKDLIEHLKVPRSDRLWYIGHAFREGLSVAEVHKHSFIDPWFLSQIEVIISFEKRIKKFRNALPKRSDYADVSSFEKAKKRAAQKQPQLPIEILYEAKRLGFSDVRLAELLCSTEQALSQLRKKNNLQPVYKMVDTCAAEFEAYTPYYYSCYEQENEARVSKKKTIVVLGGGPNRIGQGIEFDYCCCHASFALQEEGCDVVMVNCNPETVSTDYDTSDRLYFEPLTNEDVLRVLEQEKPHGVIVQFGGQTPLNLAAQLEKAGVNILGTKPKVIDRVEDREQFARFIKKLKLKQPENGMATSVSEALKVAKKIGYPVMVRPSYVLGGRAMEIVYDQADLKRYMKTSALVSKDRPVLVDRFLENAIEVDVDALCDGTQAAIAGIMEHIERAGVHSGDSACCLPTRSFSNDMILEISRQTKLMALELGVVGLMNVQFAIQNNDIYILEVNPRASRTVPFVSKATGQPIAKIAAKLMYGKTLAELGFVECLKTPHISIKESVFPFNKFPGVDTLLGPEMKSTGEVMGLADRFGAAFAKAQLAGSNEIPQKGTAFISVRDADKRALVSIAVRLLDHGFKIITTKGTGSFLNKHGLKVQVVKKHFEGEPNIIKPLLSGKVAMVINTHEGKLTAKDSFEIRHSALVSGTPYFTTIAAAEAAVEGISDLRRDDFEVQSLQEFNARVKPLFLSKTA
ncbi:MAG: carbamoyl-phosphate synthase large subunit [Deltaproteobacteria bacterium]|nr:carbamoyl-phosphate synthase large subunit [Deltaproteobacteria bacterium]